MPASAPATRRRGGDQLSGREGGREGQGGRGTEGEGRRRSWGEEGRGVKRQGEGEGERCGKENIWIGEVVRSWGCLRLFEERLVLRRAKRKEGRKEGRKEKSKEG